MRLWHEDLLSILPDKQLLSQHRECCALRGRGWGRKHSTVDYVFDQPREHLVAYHWKVMNEMEHREMAPDKAWFNPSYCGKILGYKSTNPQVRELIQRMVDKTVYAEHDHKYLSSCATNLIEKLKIKLEKYITSYGVSDFRTLTVSQQLDKFIVIQQRTLFLL